MEEEIIKTFESIGIPGTEIKVYLDLLKNGQSTATVIARRTKMHRANVYDTLTKLKEKNLVYAKTDDGKKVFIALSSELLLQHEKEKMENLKMSVDYLKKAYLRNDTPQIYIFEGAEALRTNLLSLIDLKSTIWIYGTIENPEISAITQERFMNMFNSERIKNKINLRCLIYPSSTDNFKSLNRMKYTQAILLPPSFKPKSLQVSQIACKNKLIVILWINPIYTIVLESETIAREYTEFFSNMWDHYKSKGAV